MSIIDNAVPGKISGVDLRHRVKGIRNYFGYHKISYHIIWLSSQPHVLFEWSTTVQKLEEGKGIS